MKGQLEQQEQPAVDIEWVAHWHQPVGQPEQLVADKKYEPAPP